MNKYLFIRWRPGSDRERLWRQAMADAWQFVPFHADRAFLYRLGNGVDLLAAELAHPHIDTGPSTTTVEDDLLSFDGLPYLAGETLPTGRWASALRQLARRHAVGDLQRSLRGAYSLCWSEGDGALHAFADFAGLFPLFYVDTPHYVAVSNRQSMLAALQRADGAGGWDLLALSWLTGQTMICGDRLPYRGVRQVPTGSHVAVSATGRLAVVPFRVRFWHPEGGSYAPLKPVDFARAAEALLENYEALAAMPVEGFSLSLTGGKDSRLNLAAVLRSSLRHRLDETFTFGPPDSPEIECAQQVAAAAGVAHQAVVRRDRGVDVDGIWTRLREHVYRFEASVCPWDGIGEPARAPGRVHISGLGGEHYHKNNKAYRDLRVRDVDHAKAVFANWQQPMDPLAVQHRWVTEWQREHLSDWVVERHGEGVPLDDLDEVAYAEFRLPLWSGMISANTAGDTRFFPLVHPLLIRLSYRGGVVVRQTQWLHYELMRRLAPELVELPFLGDPWSPRLRSELGAAIPGTPPFRSNRRATSRNLVSWQWKFLEQSADDIAELLLGAPNSGLFDIYDRSAVETVVGSLHALPTVPAAKSVLSLVAIQLALTGGYVAVDEYQSSTPPRICHVHTNVEGVEVGWRDGRQVLSIQAFERGHVPVALQQASTGDDPSLRRRTLRRLGDRVLGDWVAAAAADLSGHFAEPDFDVVAAVLEALPSYRLEVPWDGITSLRIDPTDRPDVVILGPIRATRGTDVASVRPATGAARWHSADLKPVAAPSPLHLFESVGDDPWLLLEADDLAPPDPVPVVLEICLATARGGRLEVFWDDGSGFSQDRKVTEGTSPALMTLSLSHLLRSLPTG